ncbi:MAG: hypothetical protein AABX59_00650 [Nanoarchaeota archaeon]
MQGKRGVELTINTLIIVILALFVLVIILLFVTGQFGKIFEQISFYVKQALGFANETIPKQP